MQAPRISSLHHLEPAGERGDIAAGVLQVHSARPEGRARGSRGGEGEARSIVRGRDAGDVGDGDVFYAADGDCHLSIEAWSKQDHTIAGSAMNHASSIGSRGAASEAVHAEILCVRNRRNSGGRNRDVDVTGSLALAYVHDSGRFQSCRGTTRRSGITGRAARCRSGRATAPAATGKKYAKKQRDS